MSRNPRQPPSPLDNETLKKLVASTPAALVSTPETAAPVPASSSHRCLWTVCASLASALAAFSLGRVTAPGKRDQTQPSLGSEPSSHAAGQAQANPAHRAKGTTPETVPSASTDASAADADGLTSKQAEIIRLLSSFKGREPDGLDAELLSLLGWANDATEEDLAVFMACGKEILPDHNFYRGLILPLTFTRWSQLDPTAAFEAYLALDEDDRTREVSQILFGSWAMQGSPRDAIDHALALQRTPGENPAKHQNLAGEILVRLAKKDRDQADTLANEFARSSDPLEQKAATQAAEAIVQDMLKTEKPEDTLEWIANWPDPETRNKLQLQAMNQLLDGDESARQAGMAIFAQLPDPDSDAIRTVARQKGRENPSAAQAWALAVPTGNARQAALEEVVGLMESTDKLAEAVQWLSAQPSHPDLNASYGKLAVSTLRQTNDIPAALQLADRVTSPEEARRLRGALIERWLAVDAERATQVLGSAMENASAQPAR